MWSGSVLLESTVGLPLHARVTGGNSFQAPQAALGRPAPGSDVDDTAALGTGFLLAEEETAVAAT